MSPPQVMRIHAFSAGYDVRQVVPIPIQPAPFVYNETALQRFDFVIDAMAAVSEQNGF